MSGAPIRAVIFDLGHTVWDFDPREDAWRLVTIAFLERLRREIGAGTPELLELERAIAGTVQSAFRGWADDPEHVQTPTEELVRDALATLGVAVGDEALAELTAIVFGMDIEMPVVPHDSVAAFGLLEREGIAMGCVTNTITSRAGIEDTLRRLGMLRYLRSVVVSTAMGRCKPHPSLFRRALADLGVGADEAVFVGDRLRDDIGGAQAVGMRAVLTHQFRREEVDGTTARPQAVVRRLAELPGLLARL